MKTLSIWLAAWLLALAPAFAQNPIVGGTANVGGAAMVSGNPGTFTPAAPVTSGTCTGTGSGCTVTLSVSVGQFVVVGIGSSSTSDSFTISDTNSDTFHAASGDPYTNTTRGALYWAQVGTTNASEAYTCAGTTGYKGCIVAIFSSNPTSGWDVAIAGAANAGGATPTTWTSGTSSATANASELAIGLFVSTSESSVPAWAGTSGWTWIAQGASSPCNVSMVYKVLSSTGTQTATATASGATMGAGLGIVSTIK